MATHPVFLPGESPWTEESGGLQSMGHKELEATKHNTAQFNNKKENFRSIIFFWICKRQEGMGQTSASQTGETGRQMQ